MLMVTAAAVAAGLGMALVSGYSASVSQSYGDLRPVVVVERFLPAGKPITLKRAGTAFEVRQVPARFAPAGSLARIGEAVGFEPVAPLTPGSYVTGSLLKVPGPDPRKRRRGLGGGRVPVELTVSGAGALTGPGRRVDVLVTREGPVGGSGKTSVAAESVPLLAVAGSDPAEGGPGTSRVVLGLTRPQAIALIDAESFARRLTVLPRSRP
jgi:Flp pilus assembly protein CpaB